MSIESTSNGGCSLLKRATRSLLEVVRSEAFIILAFVIFGFVLTVVPLKLFVNITPSTNFGESIEGVLPPVYWLGIAIIVINACYMLTRLDNDKFRLPFLISCFLLVFSMRSILSIISSFPFVEDTWQGIYINLSWHKYGLLSPEGIGFFTNQYVHGWPVSYILAYLITSAGVPTYAFYLWTPVALYLLDAVVIYFLFKELANEKLAMISIFLFSLLNTSGFFPLHYSAQTVGAFLYLLALYTIVKAYKTKKLRHLTLALFCLFALILTHHMSTFFLGISLLGVYLSRYLLELQQKAQKRNVWFSFNVNLDSFIKLSLPLSILTFAIWYFYGFIVYGIDATWMLKAIIQVLTTHEPIYQTGYYGRYFILSPLSQVAIIFFPAFILAAAAITLLGGMLKKRLLDGYLWLIIGWAGAMILAFIFGNLLYGNYIEPLRALEIIAVALFPAVGSSIAAVFESKSVSRKMLMTVLFVTIAFFSVMSIYRGAQKVIYLTPPWWMEVLFPS